MDRLNYYYYYYRNGDTNDFLLSFFSRFVWHDYYYTIHVQLSFNTRPVFNVINYNLNNSVPCRL